jgi:biotin transporter BioY
MHLGWLAAFQFGALPFFPGEIIKMTLIVALLGGFSLLRRES